MTSSWLVWSIFRRSGRRYGVENAINKELVRCHAIQVARKPLKLPKSVRRTEVFPMPAVSIIIPAYNARAFLADAIQSVLRQTCDDYELIVVDDGSADDTAAIASSFPRVQCVRQDNAGVSAARNRGATKARGEFIAFLDADDIWHPDKLARQLAAMRAHPRVNLCRTRAIGCGIADTETFAAEFSGMTNGPAGSTVVEHFSDVFAQPYFGPSTIMVRHAAFHSIGGFDTRLRIAEDVDFSLRILALHPELVCINQRLVLKRDRPDGLSSDAPDGYSRLLRVYEQFLQTHPEVRNQLGDDIIRNAIRGLHVNRARSLLVAGRESEARKDLEKAATLGLGIDLVGLGLRSLAPKATRTALKQMFRPMRTKQ